VCQVQGMFKAGGQQEATEFWKNDIITPVFKDNRSGFRTEGREKGSGSQ
jgi:hypothetical protein